jgi:hypothetical protein
MTWVESSCMFYGTSFSPSTAERETGLPFHFKNEVGEIGSLGRYRGESLPYGSSTLFPPYQATKDNAAYGTEWLADVVLKHRAQYEAAGATEMTLSLRVIHDGQCNLEFSPQLLRKIANSGMLLILSCYEDAGYVQKSIDEAEKASLERERIRRE